MIKSKTKSFKKITFVIVADSNIYKQALVLIRSIQLVYDIHEYNIHVITDVGSVKFFKFFDSFINIKVIEIDDLKLHNGKLIDRHITQFTFARLQIFSLIKNIPDENTVIYLDADTMVKKKINNKYLESDNIVFNEYFNFKKIQGTLNYWENRISNYSTFKTIKIKILNKEYFNAGVIIINNRDKYKKLCNRILNSKLIFDDQTLLNLFNYGELNIVENYKMNNRVEINYISSSAVFHFSGMKKPWSLDTKNLNDDTFFKKVNKIGYFKLQSDVEDILGGLYE